MEKIATIMEVTENFGVKVFVNARTDSLRYFEGDDDEKFDEAVRAYFECTKQLDTRREVVVPDSAHGSNPESSHMAGFDVVQIPPPPCGVEKVLWRFRWTISNPILAGVVFVIIPFKFAPS